MIRSAIGELYANNIAGRGDYHVRRNWSPEHLKLLQIYWLRQTGLRTLRSRFLKAVGLARNDTPLTTIQKKLEDQDSAIRAIAVLDLRERIQKREPGELSGLCFRLKKIIAQDADTLVRFAALDVLTELLYQSATEEERYTLDSLALVEDIKSISTSNTDPVIRLEAVDVLGLFAGKNKGVAEETALHFLKFREQETEESVRNLAELGVKMLIHLHPEITRNPAIEALARKVREQEGVYNPLYDDDTDTPATASDRDIQSGAYHVDWVTLDRPAKDGTTIPDLVAYTPE